MELLLKYEGHHIPGSWGVLHGMRMGRNVWVFKLPDKSALLTLMQQLAEGVDEQVLAVTLVAVVNVASQQSPAMLLDTALPFMALLTRLQFPWLQKGMQPFVEVHFQPIVDLSDGGRIAAQEALCRLRTPQGELLSGYETFALARHLGCQDALDIALQQKALARKVSDLPPGMALFLNVLPSTLMQREWPVQFLQRLHDLGIDHHEVVIEVVESEKVDPAGLAQRCDDLRSRGLRIALDDMGAGFNCLSVLATVRSDFVKIDRGLVHGARGSRVRSVLLEAMVSMAERLGATVIAEGLERQEDVVFCRSLGIHLVQGFLLAKPAYAPLMGKLGVAPTEKMLAMQRVDRFSITDVIDSPPAFDIQTPLTLLRQAFRESPDLPWCMLTDAGRPVGVLYRGKALSRSLRSVAQGAQPLHRMLPYNIGLTALARSLYLERVEATPWAVVDARGSYMGTLEPMMLVSHLLARQAHGASLHPLSQLPTGPTLRQAIEMRIARKHGHLELVYIDLDHFKAFNDRYGFVRGDGMIRTLAEILRHVFAMSNDCMLGHIGGDDFIVLFDQPDPLLITQLQRAMAQFHTLARHLYDTEDVQRGYFVTEDGETHSVASMSVSCVNGSTGMPHDCVEASARAAKLKKLGKAAGGNVIVLEAESPRVIHPQMASLQLAGWEAHVLQILQRLLQAPRRRDARALDHVFKAYPFFEMLFELDAEGVQTHVNWINPVMYGRIRAGGAGVNRSSQPYFAHVRDSGQAFVSPIYLSSATEDFCLTIAVPVYGSAGRFAGVLVGDLNLASMASLLEHRVEA
jgi:diguanylate cyclase (GGDEF)-like protein